MGTSPHCCHITGSKVGRQQTPQGEVSSLVTASAGCLQAVPELGCAKHTCWCGLMLPVDPSHPLPDHPWLLRL